MALSAVLVYMRGHERSMMGSRGEVIAWLQLHRAELVARYTWAEPLAGANAKTEGAREPDDRRPKPDPARQDDAGRAEPDHEPDAQQDLEDGSAVRKLGDGDSLTTENETDEAPE